MDPTSALDHDYLDDYSDPCESDEPRDDPDDGPCMGEGCVNPHPDHRYGECETVEMHEDHRRECEIADLCALSTDDLIRRVDELQAFVKAANAEIAKRHCAHMITNWRGDVLVCHDCGVTVTPTA